jgi:rSAM/selenodomain-associated transferase 2
MPGVGIVIPTLNEEQGLRALLSDLALLSVEHDVVIADGGSTDDTVGVAREGGARAVVAERGRATQMNAGALSAAGDWLCFLHADVRVPDAARRDLVRVVSGRVAEAAVWGFAIDARGFWPRFMEAGTYLRDRVGGLPYGDQGLLVRRELFSAVGAFPEIPIMEDVALVRALRGRVRLERLGSRLLVSPRRWVREGPYRTWARNTLLIAAYLAGVGPQRLARWYRPEGS